MANDKQSKPMFSTETFTEQFKLVAKWMENAYQFAQELDWLGAAEQYPEGSEKRDLAEVRDDVDFKLNRCIGNLMVLRRARGETSRCADLLLEVTMERLGDGPEAVRCMKKYHSLVGDEANSKGEIPPETFPDMFAWDTYLRVSSLAELVEKFPKHIAHSATQMHGWPMIVSHHLDGAADFKRTAELLKLGSNYPLDAGPRKKRGVETPMLSYLEPLVWGFHVLHLHWSASKDDRTEEHFMHYLRSFWWEFPKDELSAEVVALLKQVPDLPQLTQKTAREWSRKVLVPFIMIRDSRDKETCQIPALRNIWQHKSVKSRATFQSRLHSAVTDTLQRFGRRD